MLVIWSPRGARVPMAWGGCVGAAGYPMSCQIGRLTRHETPLARPSQATKISKPNHFAYPFRSRPRGVPSPPPARFGRGQDVQLLRYGKFGGWCPPRPPGPVKYLPLTYPFGLTSSAAPRRIERRGLSHGSMGYTSRVLIPRFSHRAPVIACPSLGP